MLNLHRGEKSPVAKLTNEQSQEIIRRNLVGERHNALAGGVRCECRNSEQACKRPALVWTARPTPNDKQTGWGRKSSGKAD